MAVVAVLMAFGLFIPAALFASGKWRPGADRQERQPSQDVARREADPLDDAQGEPPTHTVERVHDTRITKVALAWIRKSITVGDRPKGGQPDAIAARPVSDDRDDVPDSDDVGRDGRDGLARRRSAPTSWADAEVIRPDRPSAPTTRLDRVMRRALPWLRRPDPPEHRDIAPRGPEELDGPAGRDRPDPAVGLLPPVSPPMDVRVGVERDQPGMPTLTAVVDRSPVAASQPVTGPPLTIDPAPVALEGVDMSQAPLVPSGDGSAVRIPTAGQLRGALATGGFSRLMSWLRAFRKASSNTLAEANEMHARALILARRTRNAYAQALQAFQAVQADRLDRQTINRVWQMLERTQAEAAAAAQVTRWTAALVVAAGGQQPAAAAAVATLQRNHGATATAIAASPVDPVSNLQWYRN